MEAEYKPKSVREMVKDPLLREAFLSFLGDELALENFTFWVTEQLGEREQERERERERMKRERDG